MIRDVPTTSCPIMEATCSVRTLFIRFERDNESCEPIAFPRVTNIEYISKSEYADFFHDVVLNR